MAISWGSKMGARQGALGLSSTSGDRLGRHRHQTLDLITTQGELAGMIGTGSCGGRQERRNHSLPVRIKAQAK